MPERPPPPDGRATGGHSHDSVEAPVSLADLLRDQALARGQVPSPAHTNPPGAHRPSPLRRWAQAVSQPWRSSSASVTFSPSLVPAHTSSPPVSAPPSPASSSSPRLPRTPVEPPKKEVSFSASRHARSSSSPMVGRAQHAHSLIPSGLRQASRPPPPALPKPRPPRTSSLLPSASAQPAPAATSSSRPDSAAGVGRRSSLALSLLDGAPALPIQQQLGTVRWAGILCAPIGAQIGWAFQLVYASPLLLSAGLNMTQVVSVWFAYSFLSLLWRLLVPCSEAAATDMPRARRDLATGTLISVMGLVGLGKVDGLANQLARLGGGVGDWDPVRIDARVGAGQVVLICALGVLDTGLHRMGYAAHALVAHVPRAWAWVTQTSHHDRIHPLRVQSWVPGAVSHSATIAGFLLAGFRPSVQSGELLDWVLYPPADPEEESDCDSQVRRLCGVLVILLSLFGSISWLASGPPMKPPQSPMEPASPLPPPPPMPRHGGARNTFWSDLIPQALRPSPRGGPKRAVAQVDEAIRAKAMDSRERMVYVAQLLMLIAWCPLVWFGSTFGLLVQRGWEKDRHRFRPGPPPARSFMANASDTTGTRLDIPSIAWTFAGFALLSALTSCAVYLVTSRSVRASLRVCTAWTLATHLAGAGLIVSIWVRTPAQTDIWLCVLAIPWSLLSALPRLLLGPSEPTPPGCVPDLGVQVPPTSSAPSSPTVQVISIRPRPNWPGPDSRPASDQQRLSWRSSIIRASQEVARAGSQQSARTSAASHAVQQPLPGSVTAMPMPIPSSQEDVRPAEALARAREMQAGFAFRPTDEGVSPASVSFSSPALRTAPLPGSQNSHRDNLPSPEADDDEEDLPHNKSNISSDFGSSAPQSSIDEESLTSSYSTTGARRPVSRGFLASTPPPVAAPSNGPPRRAATPPSPALPAPSIRSGSVRGSVRAVETPTKRSGAPSLHSIRAAHLERPPERTSSWLGEREDRAARQAIANAVTHCAPLPTREGRVQSPEPIEVHPKNEPEVPAILPPAGPFEMGYHGGVNPRLARLPPLTIMSLLLIAVSYITADPTHPHFGGRWPVQPAWLLAVGGLVAFVAAWVVPRSQRRAEGETA